MLSDYRTRSQENIIDAQHWNPDLTLHSSADQNPASQNNAEHENPDLQPCLLLSFFHPKYSTYM